MLCICILLAGCTRDLEFSTNGNPQQDESELSDDALAILNIYSSGNFEISKEEAIARAKAAISDPGLNPDTRAGTDAELRVKEVIPLTSENFVTDSLSKITYETTGGEKVFVELPEVLGYAVNFADGASESAGFVIVPADKRINHSVLATVPAGCLPANPEEEVTNDGVAFFLDNAEEYAAWCILEAERKADSLKQAIIAEYQPLYPNQTITVDFNETGPDTRGRFDIVFQVTSETTVLMDWMDMNWVEPLVPVEWDQGKPFNKLVKSKRKCNNALTGCVATATAQFMAYWKHPETVGSVRMDWDSIVRYTGYTSWSKRLYKRNRNWLGPMYTASDNIKNQTAYLMKHIGESIGADYHCSKNNCSDCGGGGTGAQTPDAVKYLRKSGYNFPILNSLLDNYDFNRAKVSLRSGCPILISGKSHKIRHKFLGITIWSSYKGGHAWIIDGYKERQRVLKTVTTYKLWNKVIKSKSSTYIETDRLLHNNWGWDGQSNGYFTAGVFDSRNPVQESNGTSTRGTDSYFRYKIELWYNIRK